MCQEFPFMMELDMHFQNLSNLDMKILSVTLMTNLPNFNKIYVVITCSFPNFKDLFKTATKLCSGKY